MVAGRYRLNSRRARIGEIDVWAATDDTLGREVEVTVLPTSLPNAGEIVDAARASAAVADHRLVRVLDVGSDIRMSWVVEESLAETRTLAQLLETGSMPPEEARRIAGEVSVALASAARRGVHHLHLTPHAVRLTETGLIKIAGLAIASAIAGQNEDLTDREAELRDVRSVVAIMYATMTARWPLPGSVRGMDAAPRVGAGVAAPSELVVAVPPELDAVCRSTLNQSAGPVSLDDLAGQLRPWSTTRVTKVTHRPSRRVDGASATSVIQPIGTPSKPAPTPPPSPSIGERIQSRREERLAAERRDLEERRADPQYLNLREALAVGTGTDGPETSIAPGVPALESRDGRFAKPIMAAVVAAVLLATAAAVPVLLNTFTDSTTQAEPNTQQTQAASAAPTPSGSTTTSASPTPTPDGALAIASASSIDPDGDGKENNNTVYRAYDGDPATEWRTERYDSQDNVGGRKVGVGVALRLEEPSTVHGVRVEGRSGQSFRVYTNSSESLDGANELGSVDNAEQNSDVAASAPVDEVRYVIVLLTRLPSEGEGFRGSFSEIEVY